MLAGLDEEEMQAEWLATNSAWNLLSVMCYFSKSIPDVFYLELLLASYASASPQSEKEQSFSNESDSLLNLGD